MNQQPFSLDKLYPTEREQEHYEELKRRFGIRDATPPQSYDGKQEQSSDVPDKKAAS